MKGGITAVADKSDPSRAELLAEWRSAERASKDARHVESITHLALTAAAAAAEAAIDANGAANAAATASRAAATAAKSADVAADKARRAADLATQAAQQVSATAEGDHARALQAVAETDVAEATARDRYRDRDSADDGSPGA